MSQSGPPDGAWSGAEPPDAPSSGDEPGPPTPAPTEVAETSDGTPPMGGVPAAAAVPTTEGATATEGATPADEPSAWAQPAPEASQGGVGSLAKKLAIPVVILVVVVGAVVFRDRLSGSSSELVVGDCFDAPSSANAPASGTEIDDVQHHPCGEAHGYEVFAVLKHPAAKGDPYPGTETLFSYAATNCLSPFATYVGVEFEQSSLGAGSIVPQQKGWESGDRAITCYVNGPGEAPVTGSLKGSKK